MKVTFLPKTRSERIRLAVLFLIFFGVAYFFNTQVCYYYLRYSPREGDIIFQSLPHGDLVDAIEGTTHSTYSHCGVILQNNGHWVVIEAIMNVHETPLFNWMMRGRGAKFTVYRLDPKYESLIPSFKKALLSLSGRPYDYNYDMSSGNEYCSGLIYQAFLQVSGEKMGKLEKLSDLDWKPFEKTIRSDQGGGLPLDRLMITPASLARAPQLYQVYNCGW